MLGERIASKSEVIRAIVSECSSCCWVAHPRWDVMNGRRRAEIHQDSRRPEIHRDSGVLDAIGR